MYQYTFESCMFKGDIYFWPFWHTNLQPHERIHAFVYYCFSFYKIKLATDEITFPKTRNNLLPTNIEPDE